MSGKGREGFYLLWTIAILVCLGFSVFLLIYASFAKAPETFELPPVDTYQTEQQDPDAGQQADMDAAAGAAQGEDIPEPPAATSAPVTLGETEDMGEEYLNKIVFLGDSTTYGLRAYDVLPNTQVWTPASGTLTLSNYAIETIEYFADASGVAQSLSIADCVSQRQPEYLVITLGLNGISFLDETQFKQYYTSLINDIKTASPNTKIICNSIFPVIDSMVTVGGINNANVNAANGWILSVAEQTGTRYLNTHDTLLDDTGNLRYEYNSGDGIHLMPDCYKLILEYVRTHGYQ